MNPPKNRFHENVLNGQKVLQKLTTDFDAMHAMVQDGEIEEAYEYSFSAFSRVCKLFRIASYLPTLTGDPASANCLEMLLAAEIPIQIGYTEQGWFKLYLPFMLLPKKESGNVKHLRFVLDAAFKHFPEKFPSGRTFSECVIIYRHVYDRNRPERVYRDHDNIEVNFVTDVVAQYVMEDDDPMKCCHFYCSAPGDHDGTEVYVVPMNEFPEWIELWNKDDFSGVEIADFGL